jgi:hypothetical protein
MARRAVMPNCMFAVMCDGFLFGGKCILVSCADEGTVNEAGEL